MDAYHTFLLLYICEVFRHYWFYTEYNFSPFIIDNFFLDYVLYSWYLCIMEILKIILWCPGYFIRLSCFPPSSVLMHNQTSSCCHFCYILDFILSRSCMNPILAGIRLLLHYFDFFYVLYFHWTSHWEYDNEFCWIITNICFFLFSFVPSIRDLWELQCA